MEIVMPSGGRMNTDPEIALRFLFQGAHLASPSDRQELVRVPASRRVRVLAVVHGWFPDLAAGSERMLQHMLDALPEDEFEVDILSAGSASSEDTKMYYEYEGRPVKIGYAPDFVPDLIITHHGPSARVVTGLLELFPGTPTIAVYHNERLDIPSIKALNADLEVFNTNWVKKALGRPGIVIRPPLESGRHEVSATGENVTMVNLQENKGVNTFAAVAERLPEVTFLGVLGTHGDQEPPFLPNVRVHPVTQDMREVWSQTRVILMASGYESYGMVAAEACLNGIPVIAHPTPGLVECLGGAGLFVDRDDYEGYARTVSLLLTDENVYRERSDLARLRGRELVSQSQRELGKFVNHVRKLVRE
jgi:hypothetical protein